MNNTFVSQLIPNLKLPLVAHQEGIMCSLYRHKLRNPEVCCSGAVCPHISGVIGALTCDEQCCGVA
jgi:hypothetical protein